MEDYTPWNFSTIKIGDIVWRVKTSDNQPLEQNMLVEVVGIEGNTLIVKKQNN